MSASPTTLVLEGIAAPLGAVVTRALQTTAHALHVAEHGTLAPADGGVLLAGGVSDPNGVSDAVRRAAAARRSLVLVDPSVEMAPLLLAASANAEIAGMVLSSCASAAQMAPFLGALPWLRLPLPIDERTIQAAAHSRPQFRASLVSHLRVSAADPWLFGPGPNSSAATWALLARCLSRVVDLPWCVVAMPGAGAAAEQAAAALRILPPARVRLWPAPSDSDRLALLVGCDICVWPGAEDAGLLLAAHAAGMPAVACRGAASDECVRDGITGRVVQTGNAESLANVLRFLLVNDRFRESMAHQAKEIIIADHGLEAVGRVLGQFLARHAAPAS